MPTKTQSVSRTKETASRMDEMLSRASVKDRTAIEKHLAFCDADSDPRHGTIWRRLAGLLGVLAPLPVRICGPHALLFSIPDGKYRKQVFALEDKRDGLIVVYLPDVIAKAVREKLLAKVEDYYTLPGSRWPFARPLNAINSPEAPDHVKNMLGWNRKAISLTLHINDPENDQLDTAEALCQLSAKEWAGAAATAV